MCANGLWQQPKTVGCKWVAMYPDTVLHSPEAAWGAQFTPLEILQSLVSVQLSQLPGISNIHHLAYRALTTGHDGRS